MTLGKFSYLVYMLIFTLIPIAILWIKSYKFLIKNIKIILMSAMVGVAYQLFADPFAEKWNAWLFSQDKILGLWVFNFPIENTIFFVLVPIAISSAVLAYIDYSKK